MIAGRRQATRCRNGRRQVMGSPGASQVTGGVPSLKIAILLLVVAERRYMQAKGLPEGM